MTIKCPHCGKDLPAETLREVIQEHYTKRVGGATSAKKANSSRINAVKALEGQKAKYTSEKRKEAARKAWEKRRQGKQSSNP